jgi:hypothetical protein
MAPSSRFSLVANLDVSSTTARYLRDDPKYVADVEDQEEGEYRPPEELTDKEKRKRRRIAAGTKAEQVTDPCGNPHAVDFPTETCIIGRYLT